MIVQTQKLKGRQLDWAVAKAIGKNVRINSRKVIQGLNSEEGTEVFSPTMLSRQASRLIEEYKISCLYLHKQKKPEWWATTGDPNDEETLGQMGETQIEASMRALVLNKLGEIVDIPQELI